MEMEKKKKGVGIKSMIIATAAVLAGVVVVGKSYALTESTPKVVNEVALTEISNLESANQELNMLARLPVVDIEEEISSSEVSTMSEMTSESADVDLTTEVTSKISEENGCSEEEEIGSNDSEKEVVVASTKEDVVSEVVVETIEETISDSEMVEQQIENPEEIESEVEETENSGSITKDSNTTERIRYIFDYLIAEGFTPEAAAGVCGNIAIESHYNPSVISKGYHGLFQWNNNSGGGYWWSKVKPWLLNNGYSWDSFEGQISAFVYANRGQLTDELLEELKALQDIEQATELVAVYYEGCSGGSSKTKFYRVGKCYQALGSRTEESKIAYDVYSNGVEYYGSRGFGQ